MKKDYKDLNLDFDFEKNDQNATVFSTNERIDVKSHYTSKDIDDLEHLNFVAGIAPYLRGPY